MRHVAQLEFCIDGERTVMVNLDGSPGADALMIAARQHAITDAVIRAAAKCRVTNTPNLTTGEVQMLVRVTVKG